MGTPVGQSLEKWMVTDYKWPEFSLDNRNNLWDMGASIRQVDVLNLPEHLTTPERQDVRLAIMSCTLIRVTMLHDV